MPQAELLGIKSLMGQENLQSKNYVDPVPKAYLPMQVDDEHPHVQMGQEMQSSRGAGTSSSQTAGVFDDEVPPPLNPPAAVPVDAPAWRASGSTERLFPMSMLITLVKQPAALRQLN